MKKQINMRSQSDRGPGMSWRHASRFIVACVLGATLAHDTRAIEEKLIDLGLEDLLALEVESVSKKKERAWDVAAAIYVITREDIERSGATRLQDLLEMAPGSWFSDHSYDLTNGTVREPSFLYPYSVLLQIDGVPITSPVTGSLDFKMFDIAMADIERIEVLRGSAGTIYGANAASGVISIVTRGAGESPGAEAKLSAGSLGFVSSVLRLDTRPSANTGFSGWAKYKHHDGYARNPEFVGSTVRAYFPSQDTPVEIPNRFDFDTDGVSLGSLGLHFATRGDGDGRFRSDLQWHESAAPRPLEFLLEFPETPSAPLADTAFASDEWTRSWTLNARADRDFNETHAGFLRTSLQRVDRDASTAGGLSISTFVGELELQDNWKAGERHSLSSGANYRGVRYDVGAYRDRSSARFVDPQSTAHLMGAFVQDKINLSPTVDLTAGVKAEIWTQVKNSPDFSPSLRAAWRPREDLTLWSVASRSVTTPGYSQTNLELRVQQIPPAWYFLSQGVPLEQVPENAGLWVTITNGEKIKPTSYSGLEWGVRKSFQNSTIDANMFFTVVRDRIVAGAPQLQSIVESRARPGERIVPLFYGNLERGELWGGETVFRTQPLRALRLEASHSWLRAAFRAEEGLAPGTALSAPSPDDPITPEHVVRLRASADLGRGLDCDARAIWASKSSEVESYDYLLQTGAEEERGGVFRGNAREPIDLTLSLGKTFAGGLFGVRAWGRNLLAKDQVEAYGEYAYLGYPHTVSRSFGLSVSANPRW